MPRLEFCNFLRMSVMKRLCVVILFALASMLAGCDNLSALFGRDEASVGGYSKQRRPTDEQKALFYSVIENLEGNVEYEPMNVGVQVVAGTNFRFLCKGEEKDANGGRGRKIYAEIVIHQPLPGQGDARIISISRQER